MSKKNEECVKSDGEITTGFLERVAGLDEKSVIEFRNALMTPDQLKIFDMADDTCKLVLVAIGNLNNEELIEVSDLAKRTGYMTGLHDVNHALNLYSRIADDDSDAGVRIDEDESEASQ